MVGQADLSDIAGLHSAQRGAGNRGIDRPVILPVRRRCPRHCQGLGGDREIRRNQRDGVIASRGEGPDADGVSPDILTRRPGKRPAEVVTRLQRTAGDLVGQSRIPLSVHLGLRIHRQGQGLRRDGEVVAHVGDRIVGGGRQGPLPDRIGAHLASHRPVQRPGQALPRGQGSAGDLVGQRRIRAAVGLRLGIRLHRQRHHRDISRQGGLGYAVVAGRASRQGHRGGHRQAGSRGRLGEGAGRVVGQGDLIRTDHSHQGRPGDDRRGGAVIGLVLGDRPAHRQRLRRDGQILRNKGNGVIGACRHRTLLDRIGARVFTGDPGGGSAQAVPGLKVAVRQLVSERRIRIPINLGQCVCRQGDGPGADVGGQAGGLDQRVVAGARTPEAVTRHRHRLAGAGVRIGEAGRSRASVQIDDVGSLHAHQGPGTGQRGDVRFVIGLVVHREAGDRQRAQGDVRLQIHRLGQKIVSGMRPGERVPRHRHHLVGAHQGVGEQRGRDGRRVQLDHFIGQDSAEHRGAGHRGLRIAVIHLVRRAQAGSHRQRPPGDVDGQAGRRGEDIVGGFVACQAEPGERNRLAGPHIGVGQGAARRAAKLHVIRADHPVERAPAEIHRGGSVVNPVRGCQAGQGQALRMDVGREMRRLPHRIVGRLVPGQEIARHRDRLAVPRGLVGKVGRGHAGIQLDIVVPQDSAGQRGGSGEGRGCRLVVGLVGRRDARDIQDLRTHRSDHMGRGRDRILGRIRTRQDQADDHHRLVRARPAVLELHHRVGHVDLDLLGTHDPVQRGPVGVDRGGHHVRAEVSPGDHRQVAHRQRSRMNVSGDAGGLNHQVVAGIGAGQGHPSPAARRHRPDARIQHHGNRDVRAHGVGVELSRRVGGKAHVLAAHDSGQHPAGETCRGRAVVKLVLGRCAHQEQPAFRDAAGHRQIGVEEIADRVGARQAGPGHRQRLVRAHVRIPKLAHRRPGQLDVIRGDHARQAADVRQDHGRGAVILLD